MPWVDLRARPEPIAHRIRRPRLGIDVIWGTSFKARATHICRVPVHRPEWVPTGRKNHMPLCPRCGAAPQRDAEVCTECGKRLRAKPLLAADQVSLSFPTCADGPDGCEGPPIERPDGQLRCSAHQLASRPTVQRADPTHAACTEGPVDCRGLITPGDDGRLRCAHHQQPAEQPKRRSVWRRWFRLR